MDRVVQNFLKAEKATSTDYSHKCVAKKFAKWLRENRAQSYKNKRIYLSRKQIKALREWNHNEVPYVLPAELVDDNIFSRFLLHCLLELDNKKSSLRAAHGYLSFVCKGKIKSMQNTEHVYNKIKRRSVYKDHIPKKALVPNIAVHVRIANLTAASLYDA